MAEAAAAAEAGDARGEGREGSERAHAPQLLGDRCRLPAPSARSVMRPAGGRPNPVLIVVRRREQGSRNGRL